jgi:hypothetical protein
MDPENTYQERLLQVARRFELYPDRVVVRARWLWKGRFDTTVPLGSLDPQYRSILIRNKLFKPAMAVLLVGLTLTLLSGDVEQLRAMAPLPVLGVCVTLVGVLLSWLTARRIRFVRFPSLGGGAGLDVGCAGPDKRNFETFVGELQRRIRKEAKRNRQSRPSDR